MVNSNGSSIEGNTHNLEVVGSKPTPGITSFINLEFIIS
jgi:hypothetical protein